MATSREACAEVLGLELVEAQERAWGCWDWDGSAAKPGHEKPRDNTRERKEGKCLLPGANPVAVRDERDLREPLGCCKPLQVQSSCRGFGCCRC